MDRFDKELAKELTKRLPQNSEYGWSRRIEGYLERGESTAPHDDVAIIVDSEVGDEEYKALSERLSQFIIKDGYFKQSYYRVMLWRNDELILASPKRISNVAHVKHHLDEIEVDSGLHGEWDKFWELYKPHKKAGQVILITTADKVAVLEQSRAILIKNLVIIYQGAPETKIKEVIKSIPCISLSTFETK